MEAGQKLKSLYRCLGWNRVDLVKFLQCSERAVFRWEAGDTAVPVSVMKLLRLMTHHELPGKSWAGWSFSRDTLWSPEGHGFSGRDFSWLSLTARRSEMFSVLYRERQVFLGEIDRLSAELTQARLDLKFAGGRSALVDLAMDGGLWEVDQAANDSPTRGGHGERAQRAPGGTLGGQGDVLVTRHQLLTGDQAPRKQLI